MSAPINKFLLDPRFTRFLLVGVANSVAALTTIFIAKWMFHIDDVKANMLGYSLGATLSFVLNRTWTFSHKGKIASAILRFLAIIAVAYPANIATVIFLIDQVYLNSYLSHLVGMVSYTAISYLGSRYYAFRTLNTEIKAPRS